MTGTAALHFVTNVPSTCAAMLCEGHPSESAEFDNWAEARTRTACSFRCAQITEMFLPILLFPQHQNLMPPIRKHQAASTFCWIWLQHICVTHLAVGDILAHSFFSWQFLKVLRLFRSIPACCCESCVVMDFNRDMLGVTQQTSITDAGYASQQLCLLDRYKDACAKEHVLFWIVLTRAIVTKTSHNKLCNWRSYVSPALDAL